MKMEGIKVTFPKYKIRTIVCDLGNVLINVGDIRAELRDIHAGMDVSKYGCFKKRSLRAKIRKYETGKLSTEKFYTWFAKKTKKDIDVKNLDELFEKVFSLNEDMASLLKKLRKKYRLVVCSNTNEANFEFIRKKYKIMDAFDDYVLSYKVGSLKPEKKIYEVTVDRVWFPENAIFIDDLQENIDAAKKFGFLPAHFKDVPDLEKKLEEYGVRIPKD